MCVYIAVRVEDYQRVELRINTDGEWVSDWIKVSPEEQKIGLCRSLITCVIVADFIAQFIGRHEGKLERIYAGTGEGNPKKPEKVKRTMTKDNAVSNEMKRVGHEWEEWRAAHQAKKQSIIDTYG